MNWDLSLEDYPQIYLHEAHIDGLSSWIEKILELTSIFPGSWNVLVADLWPNQEMSRLIGHVQMNDVAIGRDTGFRVCAYLENDGIEGDEGDDIPLINQWLSNAVLKESTNVKLQSNAKSNPFEIRLTCWGEGEIKDGIQINY